jgi:mRNA interferase HigB
LIAVTSKAQWQNTSEVQGAFSKAKVLNGERVRFEVAGGNYRLIVAFKFEAQIALVTSVKVV